MGRASPQMSADEPVAAARPLIRQLGRQPAWRLVLQFAGLAREQAGHRLTHALGGRRYAEVDERALRLPDSAVCREAVQMVAAISPPYLLNHCICGFVFGAALGARDRTHFDRELLFLSCAMHDLGLTASHDGPDDFELEGARAARNWLMARGERGERADVVHEAIALHARIDRASRAGPEVKLTHLGVGVDVIGVRAADFRRDALDKAAAHWPRHDFKRCLPPLIRDQAARKPRCNIAGHLGLGFARKIASAPFAT